MNDSTSALLAQARQSLQSDLETAARIQFENLAQALQRHANQQVRALSQTIRCMRTDSGAAWSAILIDSTRGLCDRAVLFSVRGAALHFEIARGLSGTAIPDIPLADAPAFQAAFDSGDTVVALHRRTELSAELAAALGEDAGEKFSIFPILVSTRVAALLYADSSRYPIESDALELLTGATGAVLEARSRRTGEGLIAIGSAPGPTIRPDWASLEPDEQDIHRKAQRFARVQAAEMRLYKSQNVKIGRAVQRLYTSLRGEIDSARDIFRREYLSATPSMVDYLHLELVRTLANDDAALLGPDYPGPMV
jgi:hypothetical protein